MSCIAPPAGTLAIDIATLLAGTTLHQLFSAKHAAGGFHPGISPAGGLARPTRFAPLTQGKSRRPVPHLYAGKTLQCAIFETIFHDVDFRAPDLSLRLVDHNDKAHCELTFKSDLRLAKLHGTGLKKIKVGRLDLIESLAPCYTATASWAQAIYDQDPKIDGVVWISRKLDDQFSYVLFGDRVATKDYTSRAASGAIQFDTAFRTLVLDEALAVNVLLV